jgi:hypothetical protein
MDYKSLSSTAFILQTEKALVEIKDSIKIFTPVSTNP